VDRDRRERVHARFGPGGTLVAHSAGMVFELPGDKPANFMGLTLRLKGNGTPVVAGAVLYLKLSVNADATYVLKVVPAGLVKDGRLLESGDAVLFSGRFEGAAAKSATQDSPGIRGYVTQVRRRM